MKQFDHVTVRFEERHDKGLDKDSSSQDPNLLNSSLFGIDSTSEEKNLPKIGDSYAEVIKKLSNLKFDLVSTTSLTQPEKHKTHYLFFKRPKD